MFHSDAPMLGGSTTAEHTHVISVRLFGSLRIVRGSTVLTAKSLGGPKPRQILEILLLHSGTPVSKDRLIGYLWGDEPPIEPLRNIESYISVLRKKLHPGSGRQGVIRTASGGYMIDRSLVDLDLDRFNTLVKRARHLQPAEALRILREAISLASGPLLGDELLPSWADLERSRLATRLTEAKIDAAELAVKVGDSNNAVAFGAEVLREDPPNERAARSLILGLEQLGRHAEAVKYYERFRRTLNAELGCAPSLDLREAHARLLQNTVERDGELAEVFAAVLVLHQQLRCSPATFPANHSPDRLAPSVRDAVRTVGSFIERVRAVA